MIVDSTGHVTFRECTIVFKKGNIKHKSRKIEYWQIDKKGELRTGILLTNNFDLWAEDIIEIYDRRWQIEVLYKQLKQNFPLKYFYGVYIIIKKGTVEIFEKYTPLRVANIAKVALFFAHTYKFFRLFQPK